MGIDVSMEGTNDIVGSRPNFLSENRLNSMAATHLFSVICGYRLVDALALIGGKHPLSRKVERKEAPTGSLPVRVLTVYSWL